MDQQAQVSEKLLYEHMKRLCRNFERNAIEIVTFCDLAAKA